jgi:uncharacterized membrane protein HdeD (DUF308 family)
MIILARNWWSLALRGVLAVLFGVIAILWPDITLDALILLFGAYALVDGAFTLAGAIRQAGDQQDWWMLLIEGVAGIAAGILAFVWPDLTALALLYLIAAWAIVTGVLEIIAAVRLRQAIEGEWLLGLAGLASIFFGLLLVAFPGDGAVAAVWLIGAYAILFGVILIALGLHLRSLQNELLGSLTRGGRGLA